LSSSQGLKDSKRKKRWRRSFKKSSRRAQKYKNTCAWSWPSLRVDKKGLSHRRKMMTRRKISPTGSL